MKFFTFAASTIAMLFSGMLVQAAPKPDSLAGVLGSTAAFQLAFTGSQIYSEKASKPWFGTLQSDKLEKEAKADKDIFKRPAIDANGRAQLKALIMEQPKVVQEIQSVGDQYVLGDIPTPKMI